MQLLSSRSSQETGWSISTLKSALITNQINILYLHEPRDWGFCSSRHRKPPSATRGNFCIVEDHSNLGYLSLIWLIYGRKISPIQQPLPSHPCLSSSQWNAWPRFEQKPPELVDEYTLVQYLFESLVLKKRLTSKSRKANSDTKE